jgi:hypothetical protein
MTANGDSFDRSAAKEIPRSATGAPWGATWETPDEPPAAWPGREML